MAIRAATLAALERRVLRPAGPGAFSAAELAGLPEPARRHLAMAIAPGTPLAVSARLRMRGRIKVGRWLPFRARQVLSPHEGFVWAARAAGVIAGSDRYVAGAGAMNWKLAGLLTVAHGEGPDVSRSAAGRAGAEAVWVPTALLPRFGVGWSAGDASHVTARYEIGEVPIEVHYRLDPAGRVVSLVFERWGDPDSSGTWGWHPFGGEIIGYRAFDGVTIPMPGASAGSTGPTGGRAGSSSGTRSWTCSWSPPRTDSSRARLLSPASSSGLWRIAEAGGPEIFCIGRGTGRRYRAAEDCPGGRPRNPPQLARGLAGVREPVGERVLPGD